MISMSNILAFGNKGVFEMHAMHMQIWSTATVKETLFLYVVEVEETIKCVLFVMTWSSAQMNMSPQRRIPLHEQIHNRYRKIRK
jgi:hypothetical protein